MDNAHPDILSKSKLKQLVRNGWEVARCDGVSINKPDIAVLRREQQGELEVMIMLPSGTLIVSSNSE